MDRDDATAEDAAGSWFVYVLVSESRVRTYVGVTTDVVRRLAQHNGELAGGAKSTRAGRPWQVAAVHGPLPERAQAQQIEAVLKHTRGEHRVHVLQTLVMS